MHDIVMWPCDTSCDHDVLYIVAIWSSGNTSCNYMSYQYLSCDHHVILLMQLVRSFVLGWCEEEGAAAKGSTRSSRLHLVGEAAMYLSEVRELNSV